MRLGDGMKTNLRNTGYEDWTWRELSGISGVEPSGFLTTVLVIRASVVCTWTLTRWHRPWMCTQYQLLVQGAISNL
jgi:hypothetical protein